MPREIRITFSSSEPQRLDKILFKEMQILGADAPTRSQIKLLIESGAVEVNGSPVLKAGTPIRPGAELAVHIPEADSGAIPTLAMPLMVLYEDSDVIVVDKPAGISMHPGAGNLRNTMVNALAHHFGTELPELFSGGQRPGIVHRLDKDTTGVVVVAKSPMAHANLAAQFAARTIRREYQALALSTPRALRAINAAESGTIETRIGRDPHDRKRMAVVGGDAGKVAITHWRVLDRYLHGILLSLRLESGRTHQIRVHLTHMGSPLIGDRTYGDFSVLPPKLRIAAEKFGRQALHAASLEFTHPRSEKRLSFQSALPQDLEKLVRIFREEQK